MGSLRGLPLNPPDDPSGTRAHSRRLSLTSPKNFRLDCVPPAPSADGRKRVRDCVPARGYGKSPPQCGGNVAKRQRGTGRVRRGAPVTAESGAPVTAVSGAPVTAEKKLRGDKRRAASRGRAAARWDRQLCGFGPLGSAARLRARIFPPQRGAASLP